MTARRIRFVFVANKIRNDPRFDLGFVTGAEQSLAGEITDAQKQALFEEIDKSLKQRCVRNEQPHDTCLTIHDFETVALVLYNRECLPSTDHFNGFYADITKLGRNLHLLDA